MLATAAVAVAAAVSQRCRAQSMLQLDTETKITRFVNGENLPVPLGVPPQPAVGRPFDRLPELPSPPGRGPPPPPAPPRPAPPRPPPRQIPANGPYFSNIMEK